MADNGGDNIPHSQDARTTDNSVDFSNSSSRSVPTAATSKSGSACASSSFSILKTTTSTHNNDDDDEINVVDNRQHIIQPAAGTNTRKPRGRPPGSKNKPKPPIVITRDSDCAMKPVILEISPGADIIDSIISFARRNQASISVMSVSGSVATVTLRHPTAPLPLMSFHGPFILLSLSGTFHGSRNLTSPTTTCPSIPPSFSVSFVGHQGQVIGGILDGKMTAASQVVVVASTFVNPSFHRLPIFEEGGTSAAVGGGGSGGSGATEQSCSSAGMPILPIYGGGGVVGNPAPINYQTPLAAAMQWRPRPPF